MQSTTEFNSEITCPACGHTRAETMPGDACIFFYECTSCHAVLRPKRGDCCVFCSYGSHKCPPVQTRQGCCANAPMADAASGEP